ncbi:uncharacterized protein LOC135374657 [Ornithodoros turicata]|uniref:uncharacterized protein LOC135374657 n=1 Tax=Ornithodoros turicata TaxID=34597 RepID=UPI0031386F23
MPAVYQFTSPKCHWRVLSLKDLFRHLHGSHGHEKNWICGLSGCVQSFTHFPSYRKHVYRKHLDLLHKETRDLSTELETCHGTPAVDTHTDASADADISDDTTTGANDGEQQQHSLQSDHDSSSAAGEPDRVKQFALLFLKWKESKRLPEATGDEIANDVISYVQGLTEDLSRKPTQQWAHILSSVGDGMEMLSTKGDRTDYWSTCLPFVEPRTIVIGTDERGKRNVFHYVPILEILKNLLEVPDIYSNFCCPDKEDGYLKTAFDGTAFIDHAYFNGDEEMICIQLYADEFEVCDPLGSKRGKHKLLGVYFSILNLPQRIRSSLSQIHLVLLVNHTHISAYGLDKVFAHLMEDVASLENEGLTVKGQTLKGTVFIVTGDNLSCHRLGGFKCNFSGGRICRFCLALRYEVSNKHLEADFVSMTPEGHLHHLDMLKSGIPTLSLYGVREPCTFNFTGFHPTEHFPTDIMHDILEGVISFVMMHIIDYLMSNGFFSLCHLSKCIES